MEVLANGSARALAGSVRALCPRHGEVLRGLLSEKTRVTLQAKLAGMESSRTWYADIYRKAIYGPMLFRQDGFEEVREKVCQQFPGYRILADLYLEKTGDDRGFPWHTDFDSNGFMERPEQMVTIWIPLTPVNSSCGGQLSIATSDGAVRLSLIRVAHQLHHLLASVEHDVPHHEPFFELSRAEYQYLDTKKFTPELEPGDALIFCNAFFHKSEDVLNSKRCSYILRLVPEDCLFSKTRLLALREAGQNLSVVNELLKTEFGL